MTQKNASLQLTKLNVWVTSKKMGKSKPDEEKVEAIQNIKPAVSKTQIRQILGLTGFYRSHIPNYATIAKPLTDCLPKCKPDKVIWGQQQQEALDKLKKMLLSDPIL